MVISVLHIWNVAGVASIIAKYQYRLFGWNTWVLMRRRYDPYGLTIYGEILDTGSLSFYVKSFIKARGYDIVHIHYLDRLVPWIKRFYRNKCIVIHYHGSDIRGKWFIRRSKWLKADLVLVATPDLYNESPEEYRGNKIYYLPNPVDTELFKPMNIARKRNTALYLYSRKNIKLRESLEWAREIARKHGLKLEVINIDEKPIKYIELPRILNQYEYFIDHRYVEALSKTALEALACNTKVIRWDGEIVEKLPQQHRPEKVVELLKKYYREKCRNIDLG